MPRKRRLIFRELTKEQYLANCNFPSTIIGSPPKRDFSSYFHLNIQTKNPFKVDKMNNLNESNIKKENDFSISNDFTNPKGNDRNIQDICIKQENEENKRKNENLPFRPIVQEANNLNEWKKEGFTQDKKIKKNDSPSNEKVKSQIQSPQIYLKNEENPNDSKNKNLSERSPNVPHLLMEPLSTSSHYDKEGKSSGFSSPSLIPIGVKNKDYNEKNKEIGDTKSSTINLIKNRNSTTRIEYSSPNSDSKMHTKNNQPLFERIPEQVESKINSYDLSQGFKNSQILQKDFDNRGNSFQKRNDSNSPLNNESKKKINEGYLSNKNKDNSDPYLNDSSARKINKSRFSPEKHSENKNMLNLIYKSSFDLVPKQESPIEFKNSLSRSASPGVRESSLRRSEGEEMREIDLKNEIIELKSELENERINRETYEDQITYAKETIDILHDKIESIEKNKQNLNKYKTIAEETSNEAEKLKFLCDKKQEIDYLLKEIKTIERLAKSQELINTQKELSEKKEQEKVINEIIALLEEKEKIILQNEKINVTIEKVRKDLLNTRIRRTSKKIQRKVQQVKEFRKERSPTKFDPNKNLLIQEALKATHNANKPKMISMVEEIFGEKIITA